MNYRFTEKALNMFKAEETFKEAVQVMWPDVDPEYVLNDIGEENIGSPMNNITNLKCAIEAIDGQTMECFDLEVLEDQFGINGTDPESYLEDELIEAA